MTPEVWFFCPRNTAYVSSGMFRLIGVRAHNLPLCTCSSSFVVTGWGDPGKCPGRTFIVFIFPFKIFLSNNVKTLQCCCELLTSTFAHHIYFAICMKFWEATTRSIFKIQPFNSGSTRKYLQIGLGNQISLAHGWIPAGWAFLCVVPSPLILLIICTVYFYTGSYSLEK